ncbi:hypothetical protein I79_025032 [Cricetulus griseus]|uniref:Uncharacterized protein n=1 Tax=Cricetulus griseus TaxID=10029 RepID=G3IM97_CRIGR|nr:hypothetical protein I79_025032 [Cricetulus griseus]
MNQKYSAGSSFTTSTYLLRAGCYHTQCGMVVHSNLIGCYWAASDPLDLRTPFLLETWEHVTSSSFSSLHLPQWT